MEGARQRGRRAQREGPAGAGRARSRSRSRRCSPTSFKRHGIEHVVLNAKPEHAEREGETIAQAGRIGAVTIATNMAGRGVDIKLGGDPEQMARHGSCARRASSPAPRATRSRGRRRLAELEEQTAEEGEKVQRLRRPLHLRHRAPRVAADRQPASRPLRPPGRPGRVALLPLRRGRPDPPLRRRADLQDPRPARPGGRGGRGVPARGEDAHEADRERAEEGRAAELPDPQARPRVRRRDERAAPGRLQVPARDPRGPRHVRRRRARSSPGSSSASSTSTPRATSSRSGTSPGLQTRRPLAVAGRRSTSPSSTRTPTARRSASS